jgi:DNA-binding winged helix-turn-helix (wHTH) protein/predicted ATPase
MTGDREFRFGPYCLDRANARLTHDGQPVPLKPKVFDVLAHLVENAGRLVTQEELLAEIWPDTIVGDSSLKSCIRQIRQALGDDARTPQFIETMHRRGYSFIAAVTTVGVEKKLTQLAGTLAAGNEVGLAKVLVGRERELSALGASLAIARQGRRQVVFVTGGPGSGKTALVEKFLRQAQRNGELLVAAGQCFEQFGSGEAYLPILEAIGRLGRGPHAGRLKQVLAGHAPTWLAQLPALRTGDGAGTATAAPPERMLREMAEALERLAADTPLVLILEDLHWADYSTLDLLSALARRREPAGLMVIATYRPAEAALSGHPLRSVKQDLQTHDLCRELALGLLSDGAIRDYLAARFPEGSWPTGLALLLYRRTEGLPLFLVNLIDEWIELGILVRSESRWELARALDELDVVVPASIRSLIEKQLERLAPPELQALEGACVAGVEFAAAAAAAALEEDPLSTEEQCEALTRRHQFLLRQGTTQWPDGTASAKYRFGHELVHRVVSEGIAPSRRQRLHRRLAERLEAAHAANVNEVAADLAIRFDQGAEAATAAHYFEMAADRAARQYAHREAIDYLHRALNSVGRLTPAERIEPELQLQLNLGVQLQITGGFGNPHARRAFDRARELSEQSADYARTFPALWGLWLYHKARSDLATAQAMALELFALAKRIGDPALELQAHQALAVTALCAGEPTATRLHMELGIALYDPDRHHAHAYSFGQDPGVALRSFGALALWLLGYPNEALQASRDALRLSHELVQPSSQALALHFAAMLHQSLGDGQATLACADLAITIAAEQGHCFWQAGSTIMRGWAIAECGDRRQGIALMKQGIESCQQSGNVTYCTYYMALLAEALGRDGQVDEALLMLDRADALLARTSELLIEAELHRLRGELIFKKAPNPSDDMRREAEACFQNALSVSRRQQSKSLELRAAQTISRFCPESLAAKTSVADAQAFIGEGI